MTTVNKTNLLGLDRAGLEAFFADLGEKAFRATQVLKWIHHFGVSDFDEMTNISKDLRAKLKEVAEVHVPELITEQSSADGTQKWLLKLDSGNCIETVFIPEKGRGTLCVSSQVGCALECSFCSTGQQGFNRNLSSAEIIAQLWVANRTLGHDPKGDRVLSNVVLMGMGEPLLNFDNVVTAMSIMQDDFAYGLSKRRVTLSTAGVVPALERLAETSDVALALSLHATRNELRDELVPLNKKYPIAEVLAACKKYVGDSRKRITIEYVMLKGINDTAKDARELAKLLHDLPCKINLIPFNPFPGSNYVCSSRASIERFTESLAKKGFTVVTRKTRGDDIDAACGQLAGKVEDKSRRHSRTIPIASEGQR